MVNISLVLFYRLVKSLWMQAYTENKNKHGEMGLMNIEVILSHQQLLCKTAFSSVRSCRCVIEQGPFAIVLSIVKSYSRTVRSVSAVQHCPHKMNTTSFLRCH